jgi:hypothetical protein
MYLYYDFFSKIPNFVVRTMTTYFAILLGIGYWLFGKAQSKIFNIHFVEKSVTGHLL